jgi:very-short-patch-repair endonuclease
MNPPDQKHSPRVRGTSRESEQAARLLRRRMTPAEQHMWDALQGRRLGGNKFRAQHPLGHHIADFCCPAARLIVELDGDIHDATQEHDALRTENLERFGWRVLRFRNEEVLYDRERVLAQIADACAAATEPADEKEDGPPSPPILGGGEVR